MSRRRHWMLGGAAAVLLFLGAFLFNDTPQAEATLVVQQGEVTVEQGVDLLFQAGSRRQRTVPAGEALALQAGDTLRLGPGAAAQLRFQDGSSIDLSEEALLHIVELVDTAESFRVRLFLFAGRTVNRVVHLMNAGDAFTISTPSSTTSVRGTVFSVHVLDDEHSTVSCDEGRVWVSRESEGVEVPAGYQITVERGRPLEPEPQPEFDPGAPPVAQAALGEPTTAAQPWPAGTSEQALPGAARVGPAGGLPMTRAGEQTTSPADGAAEQLVLLPASDGAPAPAGITDWPTPTDSASESEPEELVEDEGAECPGGSCEAIVPTAVCAGPAGESNPHCATLVTGVPLPPTATPLSTATPLPTATPVPTATPLPTATPTATPMAALDE